MNRTLHTFRYILIDYLSALCAWCVFFVFRKIELENSIIDHYMNILGDTNFIIEIIFLPFFWLIIYTFSGSYRKIYRKSRLQELGQTLLSTTIGVLTIFFVILIDDTIDVYEYSYYYYSIISLWCIHFFITYLPRVLLTSRTLRRIRTHKIGFSTIIVGSNGKALNIFQELQRDSRSCSNKFVGFVNVEEYDTYPLSSYMPHLGFYKDLKKIIKDYKIEEVIIAMERSETNTIDKIIREISKTGTYIKVLPEMSDILMGAVKTTLIWSPFIEIYQETNLWLDFLKRVIDIFMSIFAIIILIPCYIFVAIGVKYSSPGPIIYRQIRIGKNGRPFYMLKFRSMYIDAEKNGLPQLSSDDDPRITPFGHFLRKIRLDEIPQFFSVLKGEMSLVGPRPERPYFIQKIAKIAPEYYLLQSIKPGITSWGQVKFGYAENIDEMVQRLKYDLLYLENRSLVTDLKILIYTIIIIFQGRGK
ncbi:MAG: sugar transferase [Bacteroidales bacterium]|nr:sugar transferase [Bacteroidales bacterium]